MGKRSIQENIDKNDDSFLRLSASIACMRFPLAVIIIINHSYTIVSLPDYHYYFKFIYPISLWIGQTAVPAFFFISGLWFFYSTKTYKEKIKDRIHTLVIPYFLWNTIMLSAFLIAYFLGYNLIINQIKSIAEYGFIDFIRAYWDCGSWSFGNGKPVYTPMWFVRNLYILCIISPIFKILIKRTNYLLPLSLGIFWLFCPGFWIIIESTFAFCLGAYFPLRNVNPIVFLEKHSKWFLSLFILFGLCDTITNTIFPIPYNLQIHRLALLTNIIVLPLIGKFFINHHIQMKSLSNMTFFIYCIHLPIVALFRKPVLWFPELTDTAHIILYFSTIVVVSFITVGLSIMAKKIMPGFVKMATGNRN